LAFLPPSSTRVSNIYSGLLIGGQVTGPSLIVIPIDYRENAILTRRLGVITMGL
jgi:hypothetical protein